MSKKHSGGLWKLQKSIREANIELNIDELFDFLEKREAVRNGESFDDDVLMNSKILNVFREHDKTSVWIEDNVQGDPFEYFWWCRWINRIDVLTQFFPDKVLPDGPISNQSAYQLNPSLAKGFGYKKMREVFEKELPNLWKDVEVAYRESNSLEEAAYSMNKAFGGRSQFVMFQIAIDMAKHENDLDMLRSRPYYGTGSNNFVNEIHYEEILEAVKRDKPSWVIREVFPFDVENWLCEYRKYRIRQINGIPKNRNYKGNKQKLF